MSWRRSIVINKTQLDCRVAAIWKSKIESSPWRSPTLPPAPAIRPADAAARYYRLRGPVCPFAVAAPDGDCGSGVPRRIDLLSCGGQRDWHAAASDEQVAEETAAGPPEIGIRRPRPQDFAPATQLSQRRSLGWTIVVASSVGVTSGAIGGGLWTFLAGRGHVALLNIAVGTIGFAVLGGMAAFAMAGFAQVLAGAIWPAIGPPAGTAPPESSGE